MSSFNVVTLSGRLARPVELKQVQLSSGATSCARITLAIAPMTKKADTRTAEQKEAGAKFSDGTTFIDITLWGKLADNASKYITVGRMVGVTGELYTSTFVDKDTQKTRTLLKVKATSLLFLDARPSKQEDIMEEPDFDEPTPAPEEAPTPETAPAPEPKRRK